MFILISIYIFGIIGFLIHWYSLSEKRKTKAKFFELLLLYQIVFSLGITSFLAFFGLTLVPQFIADTMGWPACPFQQELANVNLAFGVLGLMSIWWRGSFWTATVLGFSIWIFADGIHHLIDRYRNGILGDSSTWVIVGTDLVIPVILVILLYLYKKTNRASF